MAGSDSSQHSLSSFCFRCDGSSAKYTSPVAGRTGLSWVVVDSSSLVSMSRCEGTTCCRQDRFIVGRRRFLIHGVTVVVEQPIRRRGTNIGGATIPKTMLLVDLVPTRQLCFGSRHLMVMHRSTCCARDDCSCCWCLAAVGGSGIVIFHFLSSSLMKEIDDSYSWCCLDGSRRFLLSLLSTSDGSSWWKSSMDGFCFYTLVLLLVTPLHHDNLCTSS